MLGSVLIANRGEIACRIIRTAKRLGLRTIAVHSDADAGALHVRRADEAHCIGPATATESYLNGSRIVAVASRASSRFVHPGYGFLAENAAFAQACGQAGVTFVGPPAEAIRLMGLKHEAKALMARAGVPVAPGYDGARQDLETLALEAELIGYPVMLKPVAGGGGKGMRRVMAAHELGDALDGARREAGAAFGDDRVLIERYLQRPRHVEVQVFADTHGHVLHFYERDCSLQRRHQKVVEEAPAPGMTEGLRARMAEAAIKAARAVGDVGAGTVEFLVEGNPLRDDADFYFLEMNTRLQVEHPVTEAVTGIDLVEWQFRVAAGEPLPLAQADIAVTGHAVEARLYAEDPDRGFLPSSGKIHVLRLPYGASLRIDAGVEEGDEVSPHYDPLMAKIIARGETRTQAIATLSAALERTVVAGPRTNLAFLHALLDHPPVAAGAVDTGLVDRDGAGLVSRGANGALLRQGVAALLEGRRKSILAKRGRAGSKKESPWDAGDSFVLGPPRPQRLTFVVDAEPRDVDVVWTAEGVQVATGHEDAARAPGEAVIVPVGDAILAVAGMRQMEVRFPDSGAATADASGGDGTVRAPMHGRFTKVWVAAGQPVRKGERLAVLEAMKMEHVLHAPRDGVITALDAREGVQVDQGAVVAIIEEATHDGGAAGAA